MFMSTLSRLVSAWFAFLLPCFATYKAISRRPVSEPDLHRWAMYWAVIGVFMTFEYLAEWTISWLPFYWEVKTLFLLYLSLPQTQGSTYVYNTYLQPFFSRNEADLDAGIIAIQRNVVTFVQGKMAAIWDLFWTQVVGARAQSDTPAPATPPSQLAWLFSNDAWRSAVNILKPSGVPKPPSRQSSNSGSATSRTPSVHSETPPAFPVPQHYE